MSADRLRSHTEPSDLDKVRSIGHYRQLELIGEIGDWNRDARDQAKEWARQFGINWVFDPREFDPETVLSQIKRRG